MGGNCGRERCLYWMFFYVHAIAVQMFSMRDDGSACIHQSGLYIGILAIFVIFLNSCIIIALFCFYNHFIIQLNYHWSYAHIIVWYNCLVDSSIIHSLITDVNFLNDTYIFMILYYSLLLYQTSYLLHILPWFSSELFSKPKYL